MQNATTLDGTSPNSGADFSDLADAGARTKGRLLAYYNFRQARSLALLAREFSAISASDG
jgi:hypothetical protein